MKRRIANLLIATLQLLITAVWIPTFWTLAELPWTLNERREASALLRYVDDDLDTVDYVISKNPCEKKSSGKYSDLFDDEPTEKYSDRYFDELWCDPKLFTTSTGGSFVPLIVFTLLILGAQYLLTGKVTLRFNKATKEEDS